MRYSRHDFQPIRRRYQGDNEIALWSHCVRLKSVPLSTDRLLRWPSGSGEISRVYLKEKMLRLLFLGNFVGTYAERKGVRSSDWTVDVAPLGKCY